MGMKSTRSENQVREDVNMQNLNGGRTGPADWENHKGKGLKPRGTRGRERAGACKRKRRSPSYG